MPKDDDAFNETRLLHWLDSQAVLRSGEQLGAVATWREPNGAWNAGYPEVAGYFLSFLACRSDPSTAHLAKCVAGWLDRISQNGPPLTRYAARNEEYDWRNSALFTFDLAMVIRGLAMSHAAFPSHVPAALIDRFAGFLLEIDHPDILSSHRTWQKSGASDVPTRWSTLPGVHHLKAAAALGSWENHQTEELISRTIQRWSVILPGLIEHGSLEDAHPYLYGIEGLLILYGRTQNIDYLSTARQAFISLLSHFQSALPESLGRAGCGDVLAQMIRSGLALEKAGALDAPAWDFVRCDLITRLRQLISPEGAVMFDAKDRQRNVWCSIFAWQTWRMLIPRSDGPEDYLALCASLI